ncbi:MAG: hypothetical protein DRJ52_00335 [Thermoprotei archaeon]|nr:MAG: hypothetical protein DRJ52_00335 [Thermoprotei archaeon]RLF00301.1 MAG: hypothetical protein DRJ63_02900 [Thermoprotei archaeon]
MCDISGCKKTGTIVIELHGKHYSLCQEHFEQLSDLIYAIALAKGEAGLENIKVTKARTKIRIDFLEPININSLKQLEVQVYQYLGVSKEELGEVPQPKKKKLVRRRKRKKRKLKKKRK